MKNLFCLIVCITFWNVFYSQEKYDDILETRKEFVSENDTTIYLKNIDTLNLSHLKTANYKNKEVLTNYSFAVFQYFRKVNNKYLEIQQWNTPIVVYFDKEISKTLIREFKLFFDELKHIKNLKLAFTKNIEKANYYFKITNEKVYGYPAAENLKSDFEKLHHPFYNASYKLMTDGNNKFYSSILSINRDELLNNEFVFKKIKQLFFLSLGNFVLSKSGNVNSLISLEYKDSKTISKHDLNFLKIHYGVIYEQKVNQKLFNEIKKIANQTFQND